MIAIFYRLSALGSLLALLVGCSLQDKVPSTNGQLSAHHSMMDAGALDACKPEAGSPFHFRKNVLIAGTIGLPELTRDLPGLAELTSRRLQSHLEALERFNVTAMHNASFESLGSGTAAHVKHLGQKHESQFVVKLELEDLTTLSSSGWLSKTFKRVTHRNVVLKLYIYGTEHGALFHSQRYEATVRGDVVGYPGNSHNVTTPWFKTDLGKEIDKMLKGMSDQINEKLACVPFSTQVTAVEGSNIHIKAGFLHGVRPGVTLRVYRHTDMSSLDGTQKQRGIERWITVDAVFPNRSVASAKADSIEGTVLDIGDTVRAW